MVERRRDGSVRGAERRGSRAERSALAARLDAARHRLDRLVGGPAADDADDPRAALVEALGERGARAAARALGAHRALFTHVLSAAHPSAPPAEADLRETAESPVGADAAPRLLRALEALPGFAAPGPDGPPDRDRARAALSAALDLADALAIETGDGAALLDVAAAYAAGGRERRAARLLGARLERAPRDARVALARARLLAGDEADARTSSAARRAFERAASLAPDDPEAALGLSRACRERGDLDAAALALEGSGAARADGVALRVARERVATLAAWHADAERPEAMPRIVLDERERREGRPARDTLAAAAALYERHGTLAVEGAFDPALLEACRERFLDVHGARIEGEAPDDALGIGDRRLQVSLVIDGPFNDPGFYANGVVLALVRRLLDRQAIVGSVVCAASLPGARAQHLHKDHRAPFTHDADDDPLPLPPVAVTVMIPLVALDETVGTTEVRKGSHRLAQGPSAVRPAQRPILPLGGFFLMDLALSHAGQPNRSERIRPIVNMQYTRRWFVDNKNFRRQRPLEIPRAEWARVPREHRALFDWARRPGARVGR